VEQQCCGFNGRFFANFYTQLLIPYSLHLNLQIFPVLPRQYVDACKIVKGLEPKFGYFVTKAAEAPKALETPTPEVEEVKPDKAKKARSAAGGAGSAAGSVWICVLVI
jgi:hypothetical protein